MDLSKGELVILDKKLCVVVGTEQDEGVPEGHLAVWFGDTAEDGISPEVWTVPAEYFVRAPAAKMKH
jgi:hypothetical protein